MFKCYKKERVKMSPNRWGKGIENRQHYVGIKKLKKKTGSQAKDLAGLFVEQLFCKYVANMFAHMDTHVMSKIRKNWVRVIGAGLWLHLGFWVACKVWRPQASNWQYSELNWPHLFLAISQPTYNTSRNSLAPTKLTTHSWPRANNNFKGK